MDNNPPATNCGLCRNYYRFDPQEGLYKCPDPRCRDLHVLSQADIDAAEAARRAPPPPPPPAQPPVIDLTQNTPPGPVRTGRGRGRGRGGSHAPQGSSSGTPGGSGAAPARGRGRPRGSRNQNPAPRPFLIQYNSVPQPVHPQSDPQNPFAPVPAYNPHQTYQNPQGQPVQWRGTFDEILEPADRARIPNQQRTYPYNPMHPWGRVSFANAAPRGCTADGEPENEDSYRERQRKWDEFVRACFKWNKMFILEQMGADQRSFPYIPGIHGARRHGPLPWKEEFKAETEQPGGWKGPWPEGIHDCDEAREAGRPNLYRVRCNKCKELAIVSCSYSTSKCKNCLENGYECIRTLDANPTPAPKVVDKGDAMERKKALQAHRDANRNAAHRAQRGQNRREQDPERFAPYPRPNPPMMQDPNNPLAFQPGQQTREERNEDAIQLRRSQRLIHPVIEYMRANFNLWSNLAETMVDQLYDLEEFYAERNLLAIPHTIAEMGGSQQWLTQFPREFNDRFDTLNNELRRVNFGYEDGQSLVNRNGFNTARQRRALIFTQRRIQDLWSTHQISIADRWKCYRCYHQNLPCDVDASGCRFCKDAQTFCQRSHTFTNNLRHDIQENARQANTMARAQNSYMQPPPMNGFMRPPPMNSFPQPPPMNGFMQPPPMGAGDSIMRIPDPGEEDMAAPGQHGGRFNATRNAGPSGFGNHNINPNLNFRRNLPPPRQDNGPNRFQPCLNCIVWGTPEGCGPLTPCVLCEVNGIAAEGCRPSQSSFENPENQGFGSFAPVAHNVQPTVVMPGENMPQHRWEDDPDEIYNATPIRRRSIPSVLNEPAGGSGQSFDRDITPSAPAGPPNPYFMRGESPVYSAEPVTPLTVNDIYDPDGNIDVNDPNTLDLDSILFGPNQTGRNLENVAQIEPRFPLGNDPWDGAAFAKDTYWDSTFKIMQRKDLLTEINPDEPNPPDGACDEPKLEEDADDLFDAPDPDAKCGRQPADKCKYVLGAAELGDHPNPNSYMVCQPHTEKSKDEFRDRARSIFEEAKGWVCKSCYKIFGDEREGWRQIRERHDEHANCSCRMKYERSTLCLTHTKKSYETIESRVRRYHAASMARFGYRACGRCWTEKGNEGFDVWYCISCNEKCWYMSDAFKHGGR